MLDTAGSCLSFVVRIHCAINCSLRGKKLLEGITKTRAAVSITYLEGSAGWSGSEWRAWIFQRLPYRRKLSSPCAGDYDGSRQDSRCIGNFGRLTWRGLKYNSDCNHHHHQQYFYWDACFFLLILKAMANIESEELIKQADAKLDLKTTELTVEQEPAMAECN